MNIDNEKFRQANELIRLTHNMNNSELKIFYFACTVREERELSFTVGFNEIISKLDIKNGGNQFKAIQNALLNVVRSSVVTFEKDDIVKIKPIITAEMNKKTREVTINFDKDFIPYLEYLKGQQYTWIFLAQIMKLNLTYSPRIYEFCKMKLGSNIDKLEYKWYLKDIREFLGIKDKYKVWQNLDRKVLKPNKKEINEKCNDIYFTYEAMKNKAVFGIKMTIYSSKIIYDKEFSKEIELKNNQVSEYDEDIKNYKWWD